MLSAFSPSVLELLAKVGTAVLLLVLNSVLVALRNHPGAAPGSPLVRLLGRLSLLRFRDSPGTLHVPGAAQPAPGALVTPRPMPPPLPRVVVGVLISMMISGCAPNLISTEKTLAQALDVQAAAVAGFVRWDARHQLDLVRASRTRGEAEQRLTEYRAAREHLVLILKQGAQALEAAATGLQQGVNPSLAAGAR